MSSQPATDHSLLLRDRSWTISYDTEYACQDKKDDMKAGVKSTALLFGGSTRALVAFFACIFLSALVYAGMLNGQGPAYYIVSVGAPALHFLWQLATWNIDDPKDCGKKWNVRFHITF